MFSFIPAGPCVITNIVCQVNTFVTILPNNFSVILRLDHLTFRRYEQGADYVRIGEYVKHWLRWVQSWGDVTN